MISTLVIFKFHVCILVYHNWVRVFFGKGVSHDDCASNESELGSHASSESDSYFFQLRLIGHYHGH
jgi:hypothetical protein